MAKETPKLQSREKKKEEPKMTAPSSSRAAMVSPDDDAANAALSVVTPTQCATSRDGNKTTTNARRRLFASPAATTTTATTTTTTTATTATTTTIRNNASVLVSPSPKERLKRKATADEDHDAPTAKRRLIFGKLVDIKEFQPNVSKVYKIVRKLTGSIGGNGYSGPIYGELTMGSMQKMIDLMMEHTGFDSSSRFIDVGSGIGKPNLHVAQYPGVTFSCGVEMEHTRWSLGMTCLKAILDQAVADGRDGIKQGVEEQIQGNCVFLHSNILEAKVFNPFTHVYMFSIGFPPPLWIGLSKMWNRSSSEYLICYHSPKAIIDDYDFDVELLAQTPTSMHGSKEGHTGYIYRRNPSKKKRESTECDALFQKSWDLVQKGLEPLHEDVSQQFHETMGSGRRTRRSRQRELTRSY